MADPAFHTPLVHEGILAVRGPDAAKFLQGQLTCNLAYLNDETSSLGGRCNIKGRLLSSFRILPEGDGLLLAMAGELLEAQLADLKKYAVFSKASLADESAAWLRIGLRDASEALRALGIDTPAESGRIARHGDLLAVALGDARVELWVPAAVLASPFHQRRRSGTGRPYAGEQRGIARRAAGRRRRRRPDQPRKRRRSAARPPQSALHAGQRPRNPALTVNCASPSADGPPVFPWPVHVERAPAIAFSKEMP